MCSTPKCDNSQLPSLMESDDSETDDNFEEFLMEERNNKELNAKNKNYLWPKYVNEEIRVRGERSSDDFISLNAFFLAFLWH